jgi:uncharacterized protein (DUF58 family)
LNSAPAHTPWDATALSRVRHLHLRAKILTDALLMGEHRSRRVGQAVEFADYQEYQPGMDLRHLDWRVWGRSDRTVVKRFETETELPCSVILDLSGDLATGESAARKLPDLDRSKAGFAITLAATLLLFLHRHGEPVGLDIIAGEGLEHRSFPPRSGRSHLQQLFLALAGARPGGTGQLVDAFARVGEHTRRRSWVGVISDGMEDPGQWLPALGVFARRNCELNFFHVFDAKEWKLDFRTAAQFYSPEGGESLAVDPGGARAAFEEVVAEYVAEVKSGLTHWGARYVAAGSDTPIENILRSAILGSAAMASRRG